MTARQYIKCSVSVLIGLMLSLFLSSDITADFIMTLIGRNADFEVSDFYNRIASDRLAKSVNPDIVVINTDSVIPRDEIATLIETVAACNPAIIGVDIEFRDPHEEKTDSILCVVLQKNQKKIVLASSVFGNGEEDFTFLADNIFFNQLPAENFGIANLAAIPGGITRSFIPQFKAQSEEFPSFAVAIAQRYNPKTTSLLSSHKDEILPLRFSDEEYKTIQPDELPVSSADLRGKIVLLGALNDPADLHRTPLSPSYPGIKIQAEIISTILAGNYVTVAGNLLTWILAVVIAFLICMVYVRLDNNNAQNLILRLLLIGIVIIGILIGCILYSKLNISINIIMILLVIGFSQLTLDIWYGFNEFIKWVKRRKPSRTQAATIVTLLMLSAPFSITASDTYTLYDIQGTVTRISTGKPLKKGVKLNETEMLGMAKNRQLTISDETTGKVYISKSQKNTTPGEIVDKAKKQSENLFKRIYNAVVENLRQNDNRKMAATGATVGAVIRDDGEELNANTEYVYAKLYPLISQDTTTPLTSQKIVRNTSQNAVENNTNHGLSLTAHNLDDSTIWWSIGNDNTIPYFINILRIPDNGAKPQLIYDCNIEMPSIPVDAESILSLTELPFLSEGATYLLVASNEPFDSEEINRYMLQSDPPVEDNDLPADKTCIIIPQ